MYYDRQGKPIDLETWAHLHADRAYQSLAKSYLRGWLVSTIWLGLDHSFGGSVPVIFETMIFPPGDAAESESVWSGQYQDRYATEGAAFAGHDQALAWLCDKLGASPTEITGPLAELTGEAAELERLWKLDESDNGQLRAGAGSV